MERREKIQRLVERLNVTEEDAAAALDAAAGDLLDAALALEGGKSAAQQVVHTHSTAASAALAVTAPEEEGKTAASAEDKAKEIAAALLMGLVTHPILNGVELDYQGKRLAVIPAGILLALFLVRYWIVLGLAAVGLMVGWRCAFAGPQWGNDCLNAAWGTLEKKVDGWREKMKSGHPHR